MAGVRREFSSRWAQGGASTDPGDIKTELGWIAEKPPYQYFNWWQARVDDMLAHYEEQGVATWDITTPYLIGGLAMGSDALIYRAVQAQTGNDPTSDGGTNWLLLVRTSAEANPGVIEIASLLETINGTDDTRAITPAKLVQRIAGTALSGIVELATNVEAQALADTGRAITPSALGAVQASATARGIVELADAAETLAGTDLTRALTPGGLGALASSLADPGYQTFPGGLIVQWGSEISVDSDPHDVTLPLAYPNAHLAAFASASSRRTTSGESSPGADAFSLTTIRLSGGSPASALVYWLSVGH